MYGGTSSQLERVLQLQGGCAFITKKWTFILMELKRKGQNPNFHSQLERT